MAFYHKDKDVSQSASYDPEKDLIKITPELVVSKATIVKKLRSFVEDYSFDDQYKLKKASKKNKAPPIKQSYQQEFINLKMKENVCDKRQLNFVASLYES